LGVKVGSTLERNRTTPRGIETPKCLSFQAAWKGVEGQGGERDSKPRKDVFCRRTSRGVGSG